MLTQKFWRLDPHADYGRLNALVPDRKHLLDLDLIQRNLPDILRWSAPYPPARSRPPSSCALPQGGTTTTTLGRALAEYGRIAKTLHMLAFIDVDETYRRRIHVQLGAQESRHALAHRILHGRPRPSSPA